ncbi:MAG: restriction endonuclease subunit S [Nitrospirota bacterium]
MGDKWKMMLFEDCAELIRDTCQPEEAFGKPYIGLEHIEQGNLRLSGIGVAEDVSSTKSKFKAGDILFGKLRPYFRKVVRPRFDGICSTDIWVVRSKKGIEQGFLFYWMASKEFVDIANQGSEGTKMPRAKWDFVAKIKQEIPPLPEQKAIASILGALDDKIELNRKMNETLEAMARAIFKSWFVDFDSIPGFGLHKEWQDSPLGKIPKGWRIFKIGEELTTVLGGTPSRSNPDYWTNGTIPWINSGKVNEFRIIQPSEYITEDALNNSATKLLPERTTVLAITGATLGQISLLEIQSCANQSVVGILGSNILPNEFIYFWIKHKVDDLIAWQTGGAQQHINKDNVNNLNILCPSIDAIRAYIQTVKPLFDMIKNNCFESRSLTAIRDELLPKLLSGEIRVKVN